jgi:hypothetical protein
MKTFDVKEKRSAPTIRRSQPSSFGYRGPEVKAQQAEIHRILRSTGAQAKLTVGQPNDKYEQEADRVADRVMAMPDPKLQRQPEDEEEEEEETLQTKSLADQITPLVQRQEEPPDEEEEEELQAKEMPGKTPEVTPGLESKINSMKGGGQPLDPVTRAFFEPRFGYDLSHVRAHSDSTAANIAKSINARAFTLGNHVALGSGEYQSTSQSGQRLLGHELTHVIQQGKAPRTLIRRSPDEATATIPSFNLKETYDTFNKSLMYTLSRFYIERGDIHVKKVYDFKGIEDTKHPAHYNPNDRTIYFSTSGFEFAYNEYVVKKKIWSIEKYRDIVIEAAIEEAFHAYQDTPRHRSKSFSEFEKKVVKKLLTEMQDLIKSKVIKTHKDFKKYIPYFTKEYFPTEKIDTFMKENLPGMHREKTWQLNARDEIMNQWLNILDSCYFRARGLVLAFARLGGKPGLKEEKRHKVSLIEKQADLVSKIKKSEVKLWLLKHYLEKEKDPKKREEMKRRIKMLEDAIDPKHVPGLIKRHKELEDEFKKLGYSKKELERSAEIAKDLMEINNRLAYFTSLTSGLEAVFKKKGLLI